jgi:uncharacterized protein with PQ loop repeat
VRPESSIEVIVQILGWAAALLASCVAIPQVIRIFRTGSTAGVSVVAWRLTLAANLAWTMHGIFTGHTNVWLPNLIFMTSSVLILIMLGRDRGLNWPLLFAPSVLLALITFGLDVWLGPIAFAIAAGLPSVTSQLMQLRELLIAPKITGLSMPFLVLNVMNQMLWVSWSLLVGEQSVILVGSALSTLMSLNLCWAYLRRMGLVRARLATLSA